MVRASLDDVLAELRELRSLLEKLVEAQAPGRPRRPLCPADAGRLEALLPAAFKRMGGRPWRAGGLLDGVARFDTHHRDLVVAVDAIGGGLGQFLTRCIGHEAAGLRLDDAGRQGNQRVYRIHPVGRSSPPESPKSP